MTVDPADNRLPVPQPHGGSIIPGGAPGNRGGMGAVPSVVRQRARDSFYKRVPVLEKIADSKKSKDSDRISAILGLGRIGLSGNVSVDDIRERLTETINVIRRALPLEQAETLINQIEMCWRGHRENA